MTLARPMREILAGADIPCRELGQVGALAEKAAQARVEAAIDRMVGGTRPYRWRDLERLLPDRLWIIAKRDGPPHPQGDPDVEYLKAHRAALLVNMAREAHARDHGRQSPQLEAAVLYHAQVFEAFKRLLDVRARNGGF